MTRVDKKRKLAPSSDVVKKQSKKSGVLRNGGVEKPKALNSTIKKKEKQKRNHEREFKLNNDVSSILKELRAEGGKDTEAFGIAKKQAPKLDLKPNATQAPKSHSKPNAKQTPKFDRKPKKNSIQKAPEEEKKRNSFEFGQKKKQLDGPKGDFGQKKRKAFKGEDPDVDDAGDFEDFEGAAPKKRANALAPANKKKKFNDFEEIGGGNDMDAEDAEEAEQWDPEATLSSDPRFAEMIFKPGTGIKWFTLCPGLGDLAAWPDLAPGDLPPLKAEADEILAQDARLYRIYLNKRPEKKDFRWVDTVMKSGTVADKMAAFVVLIQDSPIHNYDRISRMVSMAGSKSRREALMAIDTLREVFLSDLLAENRKLMTFKEQPLAKLDAVVEKNLRSSDGKKLDRDIVRRRILAIWRFEDLIKEGFAKFVASVVALTSDAVETTRFRTLHTLYSLLLNNPEQEKKLLGVLVNKLGDPSKKVAASTAHRLTLLLTHHPNMKLVVSEEVEHFVFRPNVGERAQYYAVCFLSQVLLSEEDQKVAVKLIIIYLSLFKAHLAKREFNKKIITAILSGIRRAFPYAKETLKREADLAKAAGQNETEAEKDGDGPKGKTDGSSRKKASRLPTPGARLLSELDGLFKAVHSATSFPVSVRALTVLELIAECHGEYADRFYRSLFRKMMDPSLADSSAVSLFLSLLFRAVSNDASDDRRLAFLKRILQLCHSVPTALSCGLLIIASKLLEKNPEFLDASRGVAASKLSAFAEDGAGDEEEERYVDADVDVQFNVDAKVKDETEATKASWVHSGNRPGKHVPSSSAAHDMRNPDRFGSSASVAWELDRLRNHYHPTVRLFAGQIALQQKVQYDGDPLRDFALGHFLDRFVQRNPKQIDSQNPQKIQKKKGNWEPTETDVVFGSRRVFDSAAMAQDEEFIKKFAALKAEKKRPVDDEETGKDEEEDDDDDIESVSDAEFDAFLASAGDDADVDAEEDFIDDEEDPDLDLSGDEFDDVDFAGGVGKSGSSRGADEDEDEDEDADDDMFGDLSDDEELDLDEDEEDADEGLDFDEDEEDADGDDLSGGDDFEPIDSDNSGVEEEEELED